MSVTRVNQLILEGEKEGQTPQTIDEGRTELSILMPCLNEAETLATCIKKAQKALDELGVAGEIIIADNGSTDGSPEISSALPPWDNRHRNLRPP